MYHLIISILHPIYHGYFEVEVLVSREKNSNRSYRWDFEEVGLTSYCHGEYAIEAVEAELEELLGDPDDESPEVIESRTPYLYRATGPEGIDWIVDAYV